MANLVPKYYTDENGTRYVTNYQAEFYDKTRPKPRKRVSLGTKDVKIARIKLHELERQEALGVYDPWLEGTPGDVVTYSKARYQFLKRQSRQNLADNTLRSYRSITKRLGETLPAGIDIRDVSSAHIESFLGGCELNASGYRNYYRHLKAFFNWCIRKGYRTDLPFSYDFLERLRKMKDDPLPKHYTREQAEQLLVKVDEYAASYETGQGNPHWIGDFLRGQMWLGARPKELSELTWSDIDMKAGYVLFRRTKTKTERLVPIPPLLHEHLKAMQERRLNPEDPTELVFKSYQHLPMSQSIRGNVATKVKAMARKLGIPEDVKSLYGLRHLFATEHLSQGTPVRVASGLMGHKQLSTMDHYAAYLPETGKKHQARVFGGVEVDTCEQCAKLRAENEALRAENARLQAELAAAVYQNA